MKNIGYKISIASISLITAVSTASAGDPVVRLPEPGTFGMFAGAIAVAVILSRIVKK